MDINKAFTYISEDENWITKLGWSVLIGMVPILNFALIGYQIELTRNVAAGKERPLPEWDNLGDKIIDGLRFIGAVFVYLLPVFVLQIIILLFVFIATGMFSTPPYTSGSAYASPPTGLFVMYAAALLCLMPYSLLIKLMWPIFTIQIARRRSIASAFYLREIWGLMRAQMGNTLLVIGLAFGLYMAATFVMMVPVIILIFIPCVGTIIMFALYAAVFFLIFAVSGHLQGQFIRLTDGDTVDNDILADTAELSGL